MRLRANPPIITVSTDQAGEARSLIEEMQREFTARKAGSEQILVLLLQALLLRISRIYPLQNPETSSCSETQLLRTFLFALEQNFRAVTSISGYAELLRVNPAALSGAVKEQTGRTHFHSTTDPVGCATIAAPYLLDGFGNCLRHRF